MASARQINNGKKRNSSQEVGTQPKEKHWMPERMISKIREKSLIGGYIVCNNTSIQESDKTGDYGVFLANLSHSMKEIEQLCKEAGGDIADWLFTAVTEDISYPALEARGIPCGGDYFYLRYRKFFWLLSQVR